MHPHRLEIWNMGSPPGTRTWTRDAQKEKTPDLLKIKSGLDGFFGPGPITNLFLVLNFTASASYAARSDLCGSEIGYSGDYPGFPPGRICPEKADDEMPHQEL